MERRFKWVRGLWVAALCSCSGEILTPGTFGSPTGSGGGADHVTAPGVYDPTFACDPAKAVLAPSPIKRLAKSHWLNALNEMLSPLAASDRAALMASVQTQVDQVPEDSTVFSARTDGVLTQSHVDATFEVAFDLGTALEATPAFANAMVVAACGPGSTQASLATPSCLTKFITFYGRKAFRRPLTAAEVADFTTFEATLGSDALGGLLARMILAPDFYYSLDNAGTLASGTEGVDAVYRLTPYETVAKLTFLFWDAPPDAAVAALADGIFDFEAALAAVIEDPRAKQGVSDFYRQWLKLDGISQLPSMDTPAFEAFAQGENIGQPGHHHRDDMIQEVLDLGAYYTLTTPGRYDDLMTTPYSFAKTGDLSHLYGVSAWDGTQQHLVTLPNGRAGLLSRAALLISGSEYTRPILKGKEVRFQVLCDELAPPPASLSIKPLLPDAMKTTREIVETATASATCQACHSQMNPLGFSTEGFDALGRARTTEEKLDDSGAVVNHLPVSTAVETGVFATDAQAFAGEVDLSQHIADTGKGQQCLVRQYFRFTYGRTESETTDGCDLEAMRSKMTATGGTLKDMFVQLTRSDSFRERKVQ